MNTMEDKFDTELVHLTSPKLRSDNQLNQLDFDIIYLFELCARGVNRLSLQLEIRPHLNATASDKISRNG